MNKIFMTGFMGRDPEIITSGELQIAKFPLAVDSGFGDKKKVNWLNCVTFGKSAEIIEQYFFKGSPITIEGHVETGSYEKKDGTKVYTTDFIIDHWEFAMKHKNAQTKTRDGSERGDAYEEEESLPI